VDRSAFGFHSVGLFVSTSSQVPIMSSRTRNSGGGFGVSCPLEAPEKPETARIVNAITICRIATLPKVNAPVPPDDKLGGVATDLLEDQNQDNDDCGQGSSTSAAPASSPGTCSSSSRPRSPRRPRASASRRT